MCAAPSSASTTNQTIMTGPNARPITAVPQRCTANSTVRITSPSGTTQVPSCGFTVSSPSTALSTEMAGVMNESPKKSEAPTTERISAAFARDVPVPSLR